MTDGEQWVRAALAELRAAGHSPRAIIRFLSASHRRAVDQRLARPALARQARAWSALGAWAWVVPAAAGQQPFRRRLRPGLAWWALTSLMLDWHLGMFESETGEPRALGAADACTLSRAWLVPLAADRPGPLVCGIGFASDGLDGALARRGVPTRAGRDLEGLVDAAFVVAAMRGAARQGWLGPVAATAESARLIAGVAGAGMSYFVSGTPPDPALARAARHAMPIRAAGLVAASLGHRRSADVLTICGTVAALGLRLLRGANGVPARAPSRPPTA